MSSQRALLLLHNPEKTLCRCPWLISSDPTALAETLQSRGFVMRQTATGHHFRFNAARLPRFRALVCAYGLTLAEEEEDPFDKTGAGDESAEGDAAAAGDDDTKANPDDKPGSFPPDTVDDELKGRCHKAVMSGQTVYVCGASGVGKTTLLMELAYALLAKGKSVLVLSETPLSLAAMQSCGVSPPANTPVIVPQLLSAALGLWTAQATRLLEKRIPKYHRRIHGNWKDTDVILIDNVGLVPDWKITAMQYLGSAKRWRDKGTQFVFVGDWLYTAPNGKSGGHAFAAKGWQAMVGGRVYRLTYPWRHRGDPALAATLERVYSGGHNSTLSSDRILLMKMVSDAGRPDHINQVHSRAAADAMNETYLARIKGPKRVYSHSVTRVMVHQEGRPDSSLPCDDLQFVLQHHPTCEQAVKTGERMLAAPRSVSLCAGARVILTNTIAADLPAGRMGVVVGFRDDVGEGCPLVAFDDYGDEPVLVEKFSFSASDNNYFYTVTMAQVPLRHAWAISMYDAIGMTFDRTIVHFTATKYVSEYGRAYAALARGRSRDTMAIVMDDETDITTLFRVDPGVLGYVQDNQTSRVNAKLTGTADDTGLVPVIDRPFDFSQQDNPRRMRKYLGGLPTMREVFVYRDEMNRKRLKDAKETMRVKKRRIEQSKQAARVDVTPSSTPPGWA